MNDLKVLQQRYMVKADYRELYLAIEHYNDVYYVQHDFWYDKQTTDPAFILMCYALLQDLKPSYGDTKSCWKYDQLCDGIRYAMEDYLHDYE